MREVLKDAADELLFNIEYTANEETESSAERDEFLRYIVKEAKSLLGR